VIIQRFQAFWRRYRKNRAAVAGLVFIIFLVFVAAFARYISPTDPFSIGRDVFEAPNLQYLFGTDNLGRDIFSEVIYGARVTLMVGLLGALVSTVVGTIVGAISGYFGGHVDDVLMLFTEMFMVIPQLFLALLIAAIYGSNIWNIVLVIGILSWAGCARIVRGEFMALKEQEFVEAARALGVNTPNLIFSEILPNATPPIIVNASLTVGIGILIESSLSFLGLGDANVMSWGIILHHSLEFFSRAWWTALFPGIAIFVTVLAVNMVGDGLNDALNPKLKER
jgi:peptide/nickel transport system permease protein